MFNLTADIVHGLACFDPHVLASLAMEQVTFCFGALFQSFCLRGWVQRSSESDYRDEYIEFLDYFRASFPQLKFSSCLLQGYLVDKSFRLRAT